MLSGGGYNGWSCRTVLGIEKKVIDVTMRPLYLNIVTARGVDRSVVDALVAVIL
jgi:hypothetical protein